MPTLVNLSESAPSASRDDEIGGDNDGSTTIVYNSDESTIFDENTAPRASHNSKSSSRKGHNHNNTLGNLSEIVASPIPPDTTNKSVTFDESFVLLSTRKSARNSRRRDTTLNSDVSLLSCETVQTNNQSILSTISKNTPRRNSETKAPHASLPRGTSDRVRTWPKREEYRENYQPYVKSVISDFESKFPGILNDYRSMSLEEKAVERQKVMALLSRLGVSKTNVTSNNSTIIGGPDRRRNFQSPVSTNRLVDETLSPLFSPNDNEMNCEHVQASLSRNETNETDQESFRLNESKSRFEKSELLLSMDDGNGKEKWVHDTNHEDPSRNDDDDEHSGDFEYPVNSDEDDDSSNGSMELVRRAAVDDSHHSEKRLSCMTPERKSTSDKTSRKRGASASGKRGADSRRSRHAVQEDEYVRPNVDDAELSARFGGLSISPSLSTPPKDLFVASQSPISPRLTYPSPDNNESDGYSVENNMKRISLGRDSSEWKKSSRRDPRRDSSNTYDSLATNTPSKRYQSEKDKRRAFREVPVSVVLKKGATFHLEKIAVKRTEKVSSKPEASNDRHAKAHPRRRRLVSFPDPLVHYANRQRRALKEMYSWVKRAEHEYEEGQCIVPAVGAFFSLSEQQIIDVCLKLFLSDYKEASRETEPRTNSQSALELQGNTLVVVRTKDDTAIWENALREGTGCSVLNHCTLPLSERIRASTAEKACLHDVVLTTYDAMKSPDFAIPVTSTGRAILSKSENDGGWHSMRSASPHEDNNTRQQTKKLSVLHRVRFKRIIFVDTLGRKCYLAKSGTARAAASVALNSRCCRLVFFRETEADGSNALLALRKSDKRAFPSVSSVLHLTDHKNNNNDDESSSYNSNGDDSSNDEKSQDPLENICMDLKDLVC